MCGGDRGCASGKRCQGKAEEFVGSLGAEVTGGFKPNSGPLEG